jgi:hypothetical protein
MIVNECPLIRLSRIRSTQAYRVLLEGAEAGTIRPDASAGRWAAYSPEGERIGESSSKKRAATIAATEFAFLS